jgi:6-phosphogluconolactonase
VANEDDNNAGITVLRLNQSTGVPTRVDHEAAISSSFVFSALTPDNKYLLASSYNGGNVAVYPVKADGTLDPRVDAREFGGSAQAHSVRVHNSGKWAYVPNKGLDSVAQLKFDGTTGKLTDNAPPTFAAQPSGSFDGPRHIAFSRDGKFAFVILELGNSLFSLSVGSDGALAEADRKAREAESSAAGSTGAHVLAHPTRNFVYASNRVSNTLAAFSYDAQGRLTLIERVPSGGNTPRDFDIDALGEFLIVANQDGGSVSVFAIEADGSLTAKGDGVSGLDRPAAVAIVTF